MSGRGAPAALARHGIGPVPALGGTAARPATAAAGDGSGTVAFRGVSKRFGAGAPALDRIDADIPGGGIFGIIGRSGAGKSTLLRLVNGLETPTAGRVLVEGVDVAALDRSGLVALRRRVGMVFQHFNLLGAKTVRDNVALPLIAAGVGRAETERRVAEALDLVDLAGKRDSYPARLSGGQKQRVGIARALVSRPRLLLCDEATSALDPETTLAILALLRDINRRLGLTVVLITHEMSVIREICDRVLVLERGAAVECGPVWQVFGAPAHPATRALLGPLDRGLPEDIAARLRPAPRPGRADPALLELRFAGGGEPDIARLGALLGAPLRLVGGALDRIAGRTQGRLLVLAPAGAAGALPDLGAPAQTLTVLGHVATDD